MFIQFHPHLIKIKDDAIKNLKLEGWYGGIKYPVIAIDIDKYKSKFEREVKGNLGLVKSSAEGVIELDPNDVDETDEDTTIEENIEATRIMFLTANDQTGEYKWFESNEVIYGGLI